MIQLRIKSAYKNARLEIFGLPVLALPGLSHPDNNRGADRAFSIPDVQFHPNERF